jgi:hypothetical protein
MHLKSTLRLTILISFASFKLIAQPISATLGVKTKMPEDFFGYNGANFVRANEPNYNTPWIVDSLPSLNCSTIRYTAGLPGNYWDWQKGWFLDSLPPGWILPKDYNGINPKNSDLITFRSMVNSALIKPMLSTNILSSNKEYQLAELFYANGINIPVKYLEFGSELYHTRLNYVEAFPTAESYALKCNEWATYFKSFPFFANYKIGLTGATERPEVQYSRRNTWTEKVAATANNKIDAIILHYYNAGGWGSSDVNLENLHIMLSAPFKQFDNEKEQLDIIRNAGKEAWLTEYNHYDRARCTHDTWAQGLFTASQTLSFFEDTNITKILCHALTGDARLGALFNDSTALLDYDKYKGDVDCSIDVPYTNLHEKSAMGTALQQVAHAMLNATSKKKINFGSGTPVFANGYQVLYGWQFESPLYTEAIILNLDSVVHEISFDTTEWNLSSSRYEQIFPGPGGPLEYIIGNAKYLPDTHELSVILERKANQKLILKPWSLSRIWVKKNTILVKSADSTICNGTFTTLRAYGGKKYKWSGAKFDYLDADSSYVKFTTGNTINKIYTITVTDENGITATTSITVFEMPVLTVSTNANAVCAGTEVKLTANIFTSNPNAVFKYLWVPSEELVNYNSTICKAYPTKTTTYTVYATDGKCFAPFDTITIYVEPVANAGDDKMIPINVPYLLKPTTIALNTTYNWYENNVLIGTDSLMVTPQVTTTYMLIATTQNGCSDTDYVTLTPIVICESSVDTLLTIPPYTTIKQFAQRIIAYSTATGMGIATDTTLKNFTDEIIFNGPLILNDNFSFTNCPNLKFGEGAYILHNADNRTLEFINCALGAANCNNKMWRGIVVTEPNEKITLRNTTISDAIIGVQLVDNSILVAYDCNFNNCYIGLKYEHFDESEAEGKIAGCSFTGLKCNLEPYLNQNRLAGILCDNASFLTIGDNKEAPNVFSNSLFGIRAVNTSIKLRNSTFNNIFYDSLSTYSNTGTAVYMKNANGMGNINDYAQLWPLLILDAGDTTANSPNSFSNSEAGIIAENIEVSSVGNTFSNLTTAIDIKGSILKNLNLTDNTITFTSFGINLNDNKFAKTNILRNRITTGISAFGTSLKYAIKVNDAAGMSSILRIADNTIINKGLQGIWVSNNHFGQIDNNTITIAHTKQLKANGIRIENSDSMIVNCNRVQGDTSSSIFLDQTAISLTFSPSTVVQCNTTNLTGTGIEFLADCNLANFKNNVIKEHYNGLKLGDDLLTGGIIGPQPNINSSKPTGNVFKGAYTIASGQGVGKGYFQNAATYAANSMAAGPQGSANQFLVYSLDSLQLPFPNLNSGAGASSFTPTQKGQTPTICLFNCNLPVGKITNTELEVTNDNEITAMKDRLASDLYSKTDDNATLYSQKLHLLKSITNKDLSNNSALTLSAFYSAAQNNNLSRFAAIQNNYNQALQNFNSGTYNNEVVLSNALSAVNSINPKNIIEQNLQTLEAIKITNLLNKTSYSDNDLMVIKSIAMQCPYTGGASVFDARGICSMYFDLNFNDYDLCKNTTEIQSLNLSPKNEVYFLAYPNPTKENISLSFNLTSYKAAAFQLFDITGRKVITENINTDANFKTLDLTSLEEGIYTYVVVADGLKVSQGKICIIK